MIDLGALFNPAQAPAPAQDPTDMQKPPAQTVSPDTAPDLKSQWDAFLTNPTNRAALLGFGIQAMQGGWGGFGSQLGQAIGAGAEAAGGVEAQRIAQEEKDRSFGLAERKLAQDATQHRETLASAERRSKLLSDTRLTTAAMRGPRNLQEQRMLQTEIARQAKILRDQNVDPLTGFPLDNGMSEDEISSLAYERALGVMEQWRAGVQAPTNATSSAPLPGGGGSAPAPAPGPTAPQGAPAASGQSAPSTQRPRYRNPTTGAVVEWDGTTWINVGP